MPRGRVLNQNLGETWLSKGVCLSMRIQTIENPMDYRPEVSLTLIPAQRQLLLLLRLPHVACTISFIELARLPLFSEAHPTIGRRGNGPSTKISLLMSPTLFFPLLLSGAGTNNKRSPLTCFGLSVSRFVRPRFHDPADRDKDNPPGLLSFFLCSSPDDETHNEFHITDVVYTFLDV